MTSDSDLVTATEVPSIAWSPQGRRLGHSSRDPVALSGSPSVPLPARFLDEIDPSLAASRFPAVGRIELREAIGSHMAQTTGVDFDPEREIVVTNGAIQALDLIFRALVPRRASVGMVCPTFFADRLLPRETRLVRFDTRYRDGWHPTDELFESMRSTPLDVLFVVNPNNPTGLVYTEAELRAIVAATEKSNALLIVDEAYEAFVYDGNRHVSLATIESARNRLITVQSFTKSFGLAAARLGFACGPGHLIEPIRRLLGWVTLASNPFSQAVALAALRSSAEWRPRLIDEFSANRRSLSKHVEIGALPVGTTVPEGATFSALDISGLGVGSEQAARQLWQSTGIACVPGSEFPGDPNSTDTFLRLPLGAPATTFDTALERLIEFFR